MKIDESFSSVAIGTLLGEARASLKPVGKSTDEGEEFWTEETGVVHRFTRVDATHDAVLDAKGILPLEGAGGQIPALGIGLARTRNDVLSAIGLFDPG